MHAKTSLTMSQKHKLQENSLNIWEKSARFAATKNGLKNNTNNSNCKINISPKEEHASCILDDNIPNYLDGNEN